MEKMNSKIMRTSLLWVPAFLLAFSLLYSSSVTVAAAETPADPDVVAEEVAQTDHSPAEPGEPEAEEEVLLPDESGIPSQEDDGPSREGNDSESEGQPAAKSRGMFELPTIVTVNFSGDSVHTMLTYQRGESSESLGAPSSMPNSTTPDSPASIETYRVTEIELDHSNESHSHNSQYYQDDFKQIRIRYTAKDDGTLEVEKLSGAGEVEYDEASNTIVIRLESVELPLDTPWMVNSDHDHLPGAGPHFFAFTPEESGEYRYFSSDNENGVNVTGAIFDSEGNLLIFDDNNSGGNNNFSMLWQLEAGRTYYLGAMRFDQGTFGSYQITIAKEKASEPPAFGSTQEGYVTLHVRKEWQDDRATHEAVTVRLSPALGAVNVITLNEGNHWEGTFENLPLYDEDGNEIEYSVTEDAIAGYSSSYSAVEEISRQTYWVMVDAPDGLERGRRYVLAAQDWGQAMYYGNPHTYYFLRESDEGPEGIIGLHRIENTDTVFTGPKTGNGSAPLILGGIAYDEYLDPQSEVTQNIDASETWTLGTQDGGWVLRNDALSQLMTLRGDNHWWNWWNPHVYSYVNSNEDGWHGDINVNYSHVLEITAANDGMARIASTQYWGNNTYETQYLYLNLTAYSQTTGAIGDYNSAGQFKFFTPIVQVERSVTITNTQEALPVVPIIPRMGDQSIPAPLSAFVLAGLPLILLAGCARRKDGSA